jgi:hypothetical protein
MVWVYLLTFCRAWAAQVVSLRTPLRMFEGRETSDADREWKDVVEAELNDVMEGESLW